MLINVLSYNMSWATQINKALGSEADFVEACQKAYKKGGLQCIEDAIKNIGKLAKIDLIGLQEVNTDIEKKIMKVQPSLKKFEKATSGRSTISIIWNPDVFGDEIHKTSFNLMKDDDRPCLILVCKKENEVFVLINLHMPWGVKHKEAINNLNNYIDKNKTIKKYMVNDNAKIIVVGDFNDPETTINLNNPFVIKVDTKSIKLKYNKTKVQARKTLKSCCWHKPKHKYKHFSDTGDYVLVNKNVKQKSIKIPNNFKKRGRSNRLLSDHMPVLSTLVI